LLQCQGGCQNLRKEGLKLKAWLPSCGSIVGHLGFLKLIVDEELNNFTVFPLNIPAGHLRHFFFFPSRFIYL
jgi:hypothetical protein